MAYTLYLRPTGSLQTAQDGDQTPEPLYDWVLLDLSGQYAAQGQSQSREEVEHTLEDIHAGNLQLVGIIPAYDVSHCTARIPGRQKRIIHQALPFAVEEQLAQDIERMHLAIGERQGSDWQVAAIDNETLEDHFQWLDEWKHPIVGIYADAMLIPVSHCDWSVLIEGDQALIHARDGAWYDVPADGLGVFLESLLNGKQSDNPPKIHIHASAETLEARRMELAALEQNPDALITQYELEQHPLRLMAECHSAGSANPINLCQGSFARHHGKGATFNRWRPVAIIAGLAFFVQLGFTAAEGFYYQSQAERYEEESVALYRDIFPDDTRAHAGNVRRVLTGRLRAAEQGSDGTEFLTLLRYAGHQYQQAQNVEAIRFDSVNFSRQRGELIIELRGGSFSQLDNMRGGLSDAGLQARIGSVVNEEDHTRARLTLSQGG